MPRETLMASYQLNAAPIASGSATGPLPTNGSTLLWSDYLTEWDITNLPSSTNFTESNSEIDGTFTTVDSNIVSYSLQVTGNDGSWLSLTNMGNWTVIPEPTTILMVTLGLMGLAVFGRPRSASGRKRHGKDKAGTERG